MKSFETVKEKIDEAISKNGDGNRIEALSKILESTIEANGSLFVDRESVRSGFSEECDEIVPKHVVCGEEECEGTVIELLKSVENREIASILYCPVTDPESGECAGVAIYWGCAAHDIVLEEMVPLRSGNETIGVTVKKRKEHIPARIFDYDDLSIVVQGYVYLYEMIRDQRTEEGGDVELKAAEETSEEEKYMSENRESEKREKGLFNIIKKIIMPKKDR